MRINRKALKNYQKGVAEQEPSPRSDAVSLVLELLRPHLVKVLTGKYKNDKTFIVLVVHKFQCKSSMLNVPLIYNFGANEGLNILNFM